jgi:hypothetical protein
MQDSSVRVASVTAIGNLVVDEENAQALEGFIGRFRSRIVEAMHDVDPRVCLALRLSLTRSFCPCST